MPHENIGFVPNVQPLHSANYRIAIIGECPNADDAETGQPFSGQAGRFLDQILANASIARDACFLGNLVQHCPNKAGDLSKLSRSSTLYVDGLNTLRTDLATFCPNVVVLLGKYALKEAFDTFDLDGWKCSFFQGTTDAFKGYKCIATYTPAMAMRQYGDCVPWITFAISKAKLEGYRADLIIPKRTIIVEQSFKELIDRLDNVIEQQRPIAMDIEGGIDTMSCCSIATSPEYAFIIPFSKLDGSNWWTSEDEEAEIWQRFASICYNSSIPKILQNGLYDRFVLQQGYNIVVRAHTEDTMLKWWELYAELEKNLGAQTSILTEQPYYKWMGRRGIKGTAHTEADQKQFFEYCCLDSVVTYEICEKLNKYLSNSQLEHYRRNVELLNPLLYMELRGIRYDYKLAKKRLEEMKGHVNGYQFKLDQIAHKEKATVGIDFGQGNSVVLAQVREHCCNKRLAKGKPAKFNRKGELIRAAIPPAYVPTGKFADSFGEITKRLENPDPLSEAERGQLNIFLGRSMNTKSPKFKKFLYGTLKLPTQYKKDAITKEMRPTTDYLSLLKLSKRHPHEALTVALELSRLRTRAQMLAMRPYKGRMHCSYNLVGSETGRITSSKSVLIAEE
jgi:uracil-DNA glycosylase family 4